MMLTEHSLDKNRYNYPLNVKRAVKPACSILGCHITDIIETYDLSLVTDQVRHKPDCRTTEKRLEILDIHCGHTTRAI